MPGAEIAQYGIGFFSVAGIIYIVSLVFKQKNNTKGTNSVIENNTQAIENLTGLIQTIQLSQERQETKIDELLVRARKE